LCQSFKIETLINEKSFCQIDYELDSSQQLFDCDNNELENNETHFDDHELELNSKFKSFNITTISSVIKICEKESQFEFEFRYKTIINTYALELFISTVEEF
jgi:hypothetical protein